RGALHHPSQPERISSINAGENGEPWGLHRSIMASDARRQTPDARSTKMLSSAPGVGRAIAARYSGWLHRCHAEAGGGKSGLHRAGCQVMPGGREPTESAAESRPPMAAPQGADQVRVKGCGKSAPRDW